MRSPLERTEEVTKGVKWVLEMMERFVVSMTLDFNPNPSDPTLIHHICEFYLEVKANFECIMFLINSKLFAEFIYQILIIPLLFLKYRAQPHVM